MLKVENQIVEKHKLPRRFSQAILSWVAFFFYTFSVHTDVTSDATTVGLGLRCVSLETDRRDVAVFPACYLADGIRLRPLDWPPLKFAIA